MCPAGFGKRFTFRDRHPFLKVELARPTVIEQSISDIAVLLHFQKADTSTNGMNGICRNVEEVTPLYGMPVEHFLDRTVERCSAQGFGIYRLFETCCDRRTGFGVKDQPAFLFSKKK